MKWDPSPAFSDSNRNEMAIDIEWWKCEPDAESYLAMRSLGTEMLTRLLRRSLVLDYGLYFISNTEWMTHNRLQTQRISRASFHTVWGVCFCSLLLYCSSIYTSGVETYLSMSNVSPHVRIQDRIATPHCVECSVATFVLSLKALYDVSLGGIKHKWTVTPHHVEYSYRYDCTLHFISNTVWYSFVCYWRQTLVLNSPLSLIARWRCFRRQERRPPHPIPSEVCVSRSYLSTTPRYQSPIS